MALEQATYAARGRFAPSPTGALHLGNVWTMLLAWLDARQRGGRFVLRMEDLDPERSRPELAAALIADLLWLGFDWDEGPDSGGPHAPYAQDQRRELYAAAVSRLEVQDLVYCCYCTRAEVRAAASAPHGITAPERCPNRCWALSDRDRQAWERQGRRPSLRIHAPEAAEPLEFYDLCRGPQREDLARSAGDFVLRRADGVHAYQLAVVVDDGLMGITHVVRGADLLDSTARQIWLHELLGYTPPAFAHVPLLVDLEGHRLSKRQQSLAIAALRAAGKPPATIIGWLATWAGLLPAGAAALPVELVGRLDLAALPTSDIVVPVGELR